MTNIKTSALALCVLILVVVCGFVFSTGVTWIKYDYVSHFAGYRCVPNETRFKAYDIDQFACCKKCHFTDQCLSFFYQPDEHLCIGCRVYLYGALWTHRYDKLPGSMQFSQNSMTSCKDILENDPSAASGVYEITIGDTLRNVYCDMTTDGGGWTVFQNRFDGSVDFYRNFSEYENGFGDMNGEFWLGLRYIQILADKYPSEFKMVLTTANGIVGYEHYKEFRLLNGTNYTLSVYDPSTNLSGDFRCLFNHTNGSPFSTFDRDMDPGYGNCAFLNHGAWWCKDSTCVHLNGEYCTPGSDILCGDHFQPGGKSGLYHLAFYGALESMKTTKMMIRPI